MQNKNFDHILIILNGLSFFTSTENKKFDRGISHL